MLPRLHRPSGQVLANRKKDVVNRFAKAARGADRDRVEELASSVQVADEECEVAKAQAEDHERRTSHNVPHL
jgi:hypothetical protein